ncbi:hypothetical protein PoB_001939200 [Plakobranchus ocellatus]|uniref:Uncharacterized protein n=1 Tax=Plakobranchus ocellatus TaxID=259542 RepID=A0AAV3ZEC7_9GAST|nr:hypothetical protein PoB_001939200 [Plakobranchus ocellatus]
MVQGGRKGGRGKKLENVREWTAWNCKAHGGKHTAGRSKGDSLASVRDCSPKSDTYGSRQEMVVGSSSRSRQESSTYYKLNLWYVSVQGADQETLIRILDVFVNSGLNFFIVSKQTRP